MLRREALLDFLADHDGVERVGELEHRGILHVAVVVDDDARSPVIDDLGDGAAPRGDDRRPARHRLDHHQPERLLPVDRRDERPRAHEELDLVRVADLAHVLDRAAEVRADELVEVADLERLAALRRDLQRDAGLERDGQRAMRALVRAHAPEEHEVVAARLAPERVHREVERVRAVPDPGEVRLRLALVHRDGDELRVRRELEHLLVHPARAGRRAARARCGRTACR